MNRDVTLVTIGGLISIALSYCFWLTASYLYDSEEIGLTTVLISSVTLIATLSNLGVASTYLTVLPQSNPSNISVDDAVSSGIISSIALGSICSLMLVLFLPDALGVLSNWSNLAFVWALTFTFSTLFAVDRIADTLLLTSARTRLLPKKQLLLGISRILILVSMTAVTAQTGVLASWALGLGASTVVIWGVFLRGYVRPRITNPKKVFDFMVQSLSMNVSNLSINLFPIVALWVGSVVSVLRWGPEAAGEFYILWMVGAFSLMLPRTYSMVITVDRGESPGGNFDQVRNGFFISVGCGTLIGLAAYFVLPLFSGMFGGLLLLNTMAWGLTSAPGYVVHYFVAKWRVLRKPVALFLVPIIAVAIFGIFMNHPLADSSQSGVVWLGALSAMALGSWVFDYILADGEANDEIFIGRNI